MTTGIEEEEVATAQDTSAEEQGNEGDQAWAGELEDDEGVESSALPPKVDPLKTGDEAGAPKDEGGTAGESEEGETDADKPTDDEAAKPADEKTPEQLAQERADAKADRERQAEMDRIIAENRQREQAQHQQSAALSPAQLVETVLKEADFDISDPEAEGGKSKASEFAKKYPGVAEFAATVAQKIVGGQVANVQAAITQMQVKEQAGALLADLSSPDKHGIDNAAALADSKEFWAYVDTLTPRMAALADSLDPEDVAIVMRMYNDKTGHKPAAAQEDPAVTAAKDAKATERTRQANLHKGTLRNRTEKPNSGALTPEEEADEAWSKPLDDDDD